MSNTRRLFVRYYTPELQELAVQVARCINTALIVDHTMIALDDFDLKGLPAVSIDRYLAQKLDVPYARFSRTFDLDGNVIGRIVECPKNLPQKFCIIDTDIHTGGTMRLACERLGTPHYSVPLQLDINDDMIDIEDLVYPTTMIGGNYNSYLINQTFFAKRTSIDVSYYDAIKNLVERFLLKPNSEH